MVLSSWFGARYQLLRGNRRRQVLDIVAAARSSDSDGAVAASISFLSTRSDRLLS
jgi:hypothetical protein